MVITIREAQLKVFRASMRADFTRRLAAHIRKVYPNLTLDDAALRTAIEEAMNRASAYGIEAADDVRRFVELCARLGWRFDLSPEMSWAGVILSLNYLDGNTKLNRIEDHELLDLKSAAGGAE